MTKPEKIKVKMWSWKCSKCGKRVTGHTYNQVESQKEYHEKACKGTPMRRVAP